MSIYYGFPKSLFDFLCGNNYTRSESKKQKSEMITTYSVNDTEPKSCVLTFSKGRRFTINIDNEILVVIGRGYTLKDQIHDALVNMVLLYPQCYFLRSIRIDTSDGSFQFVEIPVDFCKQNNIKICLHEEEEIII